MKPIELKKRVDESTVVSTFIEVNKIRKISQQQLSDILNIRPNYVAMITERVNYFLQKMSYLITMSKLQVSCEDPKFVKQHPDEYRAMEEYFAKDKLHSDKFWEDIVDLWCVYDSIGKFCISTKHFLKEIAGTPGETKEELIQNIIENWDNESAEYEKDKVSTARYAHRFFKKLLEKKTWLLPTGVTEWDILMYIKGHIYDDELNR